MGFGGIRGEYNVIGCCNENSLWGIRISYYLLFINANMAMIAQGLCLQAPYK